MCTAFDGDQKANFRHKRCDFFNIQILKYVIDDPIYES